LISSYCSFQFVRWWKTRKTQRTWGVFLSQRL